MRGRDGPDELDADRVAFGLSAAAEPTTPTVTVLEVWPENVAIWELWCELELNWQLSIGMGVVHWSAPRHSDAQASMAMLGVKKRDRRHLFNALCDMEREALAILNAPN